MFRKYFVVVFIMLIIAFITLASIEFRKNKSIGFNVGSTTHIQLAMMIR